MVDINTDQKRSVSVEVDKDRDYSVQDNCEDVLEEYSQSAMDVSEEFTSSILD
ncbi:hypothetical protein [Halorubrum trueperi]|uniref:Uncharacterized protein n=1 Tax=Halorubrum trueperi TaxID=2004704 RepID=A0ABD5UF70_9EURY